MACVSWDGEADRGCENAGIITYREAWACVVRTLLFFSTKLFCVAFGVTPRERLNCIARSRDIMLGKSSHVQRLTVRTPYCIYRSQPEMSLLWPETVTRMARDDGVLYGRR
jgi:hypothetical protein